jgi:hypothetical protein
MHPSTHPGGPEPSTTARLATSTVRSLPADELRLTAHRTRQDPSATSHADVLPAKLAVPQGNVDRVRADEWDSVQKQHPNEISKPGDQPGVSSPLRSSAAPIWLSHSVPSWRPFGNWSPRSQRHVVIIANTRIRHSRSKSLLTPG